MHNVYFRCNFDASDSLSVLHSFIETNLFSDHTQCAALGVGDTFDIYVRSSDEKKVDENVGFPKFPKMTR